MQPGKKKSITGADKIMHAYINSFPRHILIELL
jgi:hypothetical protein